MATSGSTSVTVTSWDTLKFSWTQSSQSVANNTTTISWTLQLIAGSSGRISSTASKDWSVTVNGTKYSGTNTVAIANSATKTLASGTTTITHNSDGTKSFSYSFSQEFAITFSGSSIGTKSGSGTGTLNTIPRATTPTVSASSVDMGGKVTINTPRASSSFTHDLAYAFAGSSYVSIATGVATSHSWTVPDLASKIPSATSGTVTIRCITKNGSTTIGTKTVLLTAKVPASVVPTVSSVAVVEAVAGLAAQFGALIQGKSKAKVTITGAGAKGSTITGYSATYQGKTYTAASFTSDFIKSAGTQTVTVKVKDSRGRWSAATTKTFTAHAYKPPSITELKAWRVNDDGAAADDGRRASVSYAYSVASVNGKNTAAMKLQFKLSTVAAYADADVLTTGTDLDGSGLRIFSKEFSPDYQYDLRMTVTDYFGAEAVYTTVLPSGAVIMDFKADGSGVAFFKTADKAGVDFGASARGAVLGLRGATVTIAADGDLDECLQPTVYSIPSNAIAATVANMPCDKGGTLRVWAGLGVEKISGAYSYLVQEYNSYDPNQPVYRRTLTADGTGAFSPSAWRPFTFRGQRVLWSGTWYMTAAQTAELSEAVSEQDTGIELVFSKYANGAAEDNNFQTYQVSKKTVELLPGYGHTIPLAVFKYSDVGSKYLYINDTRITGHADNIATGTGASGITYNNAAFVLRYVLGV